MPLIRCDRCGENVIGGDEDSARMALETHKAFGCRKTQVGNDNPALDLTRDRGGGIRL